jgi:hypothetical protein
VFFEIRGNNPADFCIGGGPDRAAAIQDMVKAAIVKKSD